MKILLEASPGKQVVIRDIAGGLGIKMKLAELGLDVGSVVTLERDAPFGGPILIRHAGVRLALGRGIAARVQVDDTAPCG